MRDRLRYRFDNFMSKGGRSIFVSLTLAFVGLLFIIGVVRALLLTFFPQPAQHSGGILRNVYITFLQMTDPGNMAQDIASGGGFKLSAVLAGMAGIVMLSTLIAFITTALDRKMSELRKGHSRVVEENHTLILGWNEQRVLEILRELIIANESEDDAAVVVLADEDKEYMDDFLALQLSDTQTTRIVTRSGNPAAPVNLDIVAVGKAKSVVVLAECLDAASDADKAASDARTVKALLAVIATREEGSQVNVVAELFDESLHPIARSIAPDEITTLNASEILAKILVQTSRSVGLSVVYNEVLSFDGSEMYFDSAPWGGRTFGEIAFHYPDGVPMGLRTSDGTIEINPSIDRVVGDEEDILILATDDSTIQFQSEPAAERPDVIIPTRRVTRSREHELIVGWTPKAATILREYADYVEPGSTVDVMLRSPAPELAAQLQHLDAELAGLELKVIEHDPMNPETWSSVDPDYYDNVLVLSQRNDEHDTDRIDAETIMILLLLRQMLHCGNGGSDNGAKNGSVTKLITELVESDNQTLATHAGVHDFVISNRFISMLLAQISEERDIHAVYESLFDEDGSEIYLKPADLYFEQLPVEVTFAHLMAVAQERQEVCLGVKIAQFERDEAQNFGVTLIPDKSEKLIISRADTLVVLAEDET